MRLLLLVAAALAAVSCAGRTELTPVAQAGRTGPNTAVASDAGVTVTVKTEAWTGTPPQLTQVIPLQTTIDNASGRQLRLRYREFALMTDTDESAMAALPPFDIRGTESVPIGTAGTPLVVYPYPYYGFMVAPYLHRYYPMFLPYDGAFAYDPLFYSTYYPQFVRVNLPTGDVVQKALPEGVLEPGGRITGFLYFENLHDAQTAHFTADFVDASSGARFGRIDIPFRVE